MTVEPGVPFDEMLTRLLEECGRDPGCAGEEEASADHERDLRRVLELFYEGSYARCTEEIEALVPPASEDLRASALRAACRAMVSGRVQPAIAACLELLGCAQRQPDLYAILGTLLLRAKQRGEAYAAFRGGLGLDPEHVGLRAGLARLGVRRSPAFPFLARSHPANRALGRLRAWLGAPRPLRTGEHG